MPDTSISGGQKLLTKLAEIAARTQDNPEVRVGFLAGSTYPDGTSVPMVAAVQEFGSPSRHIPPRPFFRSMIAEKSPTWGKDVAKLMQREDFQAKTALGLMGERIKGQLQQSIRDTNSPPLAPATIKAKGFDKPLIDTGWMWKSIDYEVKP